jgi:hypothetical protein
MSSFLPIELTCSRRKIKKEKVQSNMNPFQLNGDFVFFFLAFINILNYK